MATISVSLPSDGSTADVADYNTPINTIVNEINGNLDNANIKSAAAISASKIAGGIAGMFGAWSSYTPGFTNLTVSNGVQAGKYIQIGKVVFYHIEFQMGSSSSVSGAIRVSLPVTAVSTYSQFVSALGETVFFDANGQINGGKALYYDTSNVALYALGAAGTWTNLQSSGTTDPFTFTTSDKICVTGCYEAA